MMRVMPEAGTPNGKPERSIELPPRAVLAVGVTGHRKLRADANTSTIATTLDALFANLSRTLREAAQHESPFFSRAADRLYGGGGRRSSWGAGGTGGGQRDRLRVAFCVR